MNKCSKYVVRWSKIRNCLVNSSLLKSKSFKICFSLNCEDSFENLSNISLLYQDLFLGHKHEKFIKTRLSDMQNNARVATTLCSDAGTWEVWGGALCVQIDFTCKFQTTTKCNSKNHVWSQYLCFDTDICRSINIPKKAKYTNLM